MGVEGGGAKESGREQSESVARMCVFFVGGPPQTNLSTFFSLSQNRRRVCGVRQSMHVLVRRGAWRPIGRTKCEVAVSFTCEVV